METAALLKELAESPGPSGYEEGIRSVVRARCAPFAQEVRVDALGSCIAYLPANDPAAPAAARPSLMLTAHMDEIALMVTQVEKGFLRVTQVGGFDPRVLFGQPVIVHGTRPVPGLVVSVPPHFTDPSEREKPVPLEKLFVDLGLAPSEVESLVRVGDLVTLRPRYTELAGGYAACKSLDDRAGIASLLLCLQELSRRTREWDVYVVAMVQEEVGARGAVAAAFGVAPAAAVAVDATFGSQPGLSSFESMKMDGGPAIAQGPNFHPRLFDRLLESAKAIECPHQVEIMPAESGTDAWAIQVSRGGVPCSLVSIPVRFMHTPVETVCLRDVERTARLLAELAARLPREFADSLEVRDALATGRP
ncbi:MAG TPA: M20/M25/M40 family metallo-hydrolase [Spirochaetia bacterium]|nr:M20/M25/M40 family metallo-hydrolase [Spirochaetia bacterium]